MTGERLRHRVAEPGSGAHVHGLAEVPGSELRIVSFIGQQPEPGERPADQQRFLCRAGELEGSGDRGLGVGAAGEHHLAAEEEGGACSPSHSSPGSERLEGPGQMNDG